MKNKLSLLVVTLALGVVAPALSGCNKKKKIDYVGQCVLTDYISFTSAEGKNFLDNGIGAATVKKYIDGDTTHFYQVEDDPRLVKSRYIGVDTPESTGQIEPWGKAASNFTRSTLSAAKTIVLTSDTNEVGNAAQVDSTGGRYKTFIWYSKKENAPLKELRLLNLELVQEGFSTGKGMSGSPLTHFFTDADLQAQELGLNMWSGDDPNFFTGAPTETSLEAMANEYKNKGYESSFHGKKVRFRGIVYKRSGTYDSYLYSIGSDGKKYGIYVFAGYKNYTPLKTLGAEIEVVGNYTIYMGNPQITNVNYDAFNYDPNTDMKIISKDNPTNIETITAANAVSRENINMVYQVNNLTCYSGHTEIDATTKKPSGALTLRCRDAEGDELSVRVPDDVWVMEEDGTTRVTDATYFVDKTINVLGAITFFAPDEDDPEEGYYQIKLGSKEDLTYASTGE